MKVIELEGVTNVRDFGGKPVYGGRRIPHGLLYRGGALCGATEADAETLSRELGIGCIVDVRCGWERREHPDVAVPGAENLHVPFYDKDIVGIEYVEPAAGTKVVGRDVACDPDRFYRSLSNLLTVRQMRRGLEAVFERVSRGVPVYIHCSGGKDRAGILSALVLAVLGASSDDILDDYLYTNVARDARYELNFQRFLRFADGNEELAHELTRNHRARRENLSAFREALCDRYGNMDAFLADQLGFGARRREQVRKRCTVPAPLAQPVDPAIAPARDGRRCALLDFEAIERREVGRTAAVATR